MTVIEPGKLVHLKREKHIAGVVEHIFIVIFVRMAGNKIEPVHIYFKSSFLIQLAPRRLKCRFARINKAAGKIQQSAPRIQSAAQQQNFIVTVDNHAYRRRRVKIEHKAASFALDVFVADRTDSGGTAGTVVENFHRARKAPGPQFARKIYRFGFCPAAPIIYTGAFVRQGVINLNKLFHSLFFSSGGISPAEHHAFARFRMCLYCALLLANFSCGPGGGETAVKPDSTPDSEALQEEFIDPFPPLGIGRGTPPLAIGEQFAQYGGSRTNDEFIAEMFMRYTIGFGHSFYSDKKYRLFAEDVARSRVIQSGIRQERLIKIHLQGKLDDRVSVLIHYDSTEDESEAVYMVEYLALHDDEFLQHALIGNVNIKLDSSKYAIYDSAGKRGLGFDTLFHINKKVSLRAFATVFQSQSQTETFRGSSTKDSISLAEYQYTKNRYYQIEPFIRYDGETEAPALSASLYEQSAALSSSSALGNPTSFTPHNVNIDPSSFALYIDDTAVKSGRTLYTLPVDGLSYRKLSAGSDYTVNYASGEIEIKYSVAASSRIFCVYSLKNRESADMSVRRDIFAGRNFVFLKYAASLDEDANRDGVWDGDRNGDGRINLDVYERRGVFDSGASSWDEEGLILNIFEDKKVLPGNQRTSLGPSTIDYKNARIVFALREPFRRLLGNNASRLYNPLQSADCYRYSRYRINISYFSKARSYQLANMKIVPDSVIIRVDGRVIPNSLYKVDYQNGTVEFIDSRTPYIGENSEVVIDYDYVPLGSSDNAIIGGVRADYRVHRNILLGSTVLFASGSRAAYIPDVGNEPEALIIGEADTTIWLGSSTLSKAASAMRGKQTFIPFDLTTYGEIAYSRLNVNTFGSAMIEAMENSEVITPIELSDNEWILASIPQPYQQSQRAPLAYKFYRDSKHPETLRGLEFTPHNVDYQIKSGPYNVLDRILSDEREEVLAFEFDFSGNSRYCGATTRALATDAGGVDFSSLQYLEVWYRTEGTGEISLSFDAGQLNEDSDGDGVLDTEDVNRNGFLDYDDSAGIFEDRGYRFNPQGQAETRVGGGPRVSSDTRGDGKLTGEDLNGNGALDSTETFLRMPGISGGVRASLNGNPALTALRINCAQSGWKKAVIHVDRNSLEQSGIGGILKQTSALRINIESENAARGRLYVGTIRCIAPSWKDVSVNGIPDESGERMRVTLVNTFNDSEYRENSFAKTQRKIYKELFGAVDDINEVFEGALSIAYEALAGSQASVTKVLAKPLDLTHYRSLKLWLNVREFSAGDTLTLLMASSQNDYLSCEIPLNKASGWSEQRISLSQSSKTRVEGSPDLSRINRITITVQGNSGRFWLNNLLVTDARDVSGFAYWTEAELHSSRALYYDGTTEAFKDTLFKYARHGRQRSFNSPGLEIRDMSESTHEAYASSWLFHNLYAGTSFIHRRTMTAPCREDLSAELWGTGTQRSSISELSFVDARKWPSVNLFYRLDSYTNRRNELLDEITLPLSTDRLDHNPAITMTHNADFDFVKINSLVSSDMLFSDEQKHWSGADGIEYYDTPKRSRYQKTGTAMSEELIFGHMYLTPSLRLSTSEYITKRGFGDTDDSLREDLRGGWHMPWFYDGSGMKYFARDGSADFSWGAREFRYFNPFQDIMLGRNESAFADTSREGQLYSKGYSRTHDALTDITQQITLPFVIGENPFRLRSLNLSWARSLHIDESAIPYEGERCGFFDEHYGIPRIAGPASDTVFNLAKNPPWHFFLGRSNFANGRDHTGQFMNSPIDINGIPVSEYTNAAALSDTFNTNAFFDFGSFNLSVNSSLSQLSERPGLQNASGQMVSFGAGEQLCIDLMRFFNSPFSYNQVEVPGDTLSVNLTSGYNYARNMFITSNTLENSHTPSLGISAGAGRKLLTIGGSIDFLIRQDRQFIDRDPDKRSRRDDIYFENMNQEQLDETDRSYSFKIEYLTDLPPLYSFFSLFYKLNEQPMLTLSYEMLLNRYDYEYTVAPEPYDLHLVTGILDLDLHRNVRGGLTSRWALEKIRNRESGNVYKEIVSYELLFGLTLLY